MAAAKVAKRARDRFVHESSPQEKSEREQYLTPMNVAETAIGMLEDTASPHCIDLGAGTGVLSFALADRFHQADIIAVENDPKLIGALNETLNALECKSSAINADIFDLDLPTCDIAVLNPPYRKMAASNALQDRLPFRCPNYYAAFIWFALKALKDDGQLVAIVPRSWTNGAYYEGFRRAILSEASIDRVVLYESRRNVFADSGVLQEVMLLKMSKGKQRPVVEVAHLLDPEGFPEYSSIIASEVIRHGSEGTSISFPRNPTRSDEQIKTLVEYGARASTGKVVEFRNKGKILHTRESLCDIPLLHQANINGGALEHPLTDSRKAQWYRPEPNDPNSMPSGYYVLVRRFSPKESKRRVEAAVYHADGPFAVENHVNVIHAGTSRRIEPLTEEAAQWILRQITSPSSEAYMDAVAGSTQINARDLNSLPMKG